MAATAAPVRRDGDTLVFAGALSVESVPALWSQLAGLRAGVRRLDLSGVTRLDSAGLALLVELADRAGLEVDGQPPGLAELRQAYRLDPALGFVTA